MKIIGLFFILSGISLTLVAENIEFVMYAASFLFIEIKIIKKTNEYEI